MTIYEERKNIPEVILNAVPDYKGQSFRVELQTTVTLTGMYWQDGSINRYVAVNLDTGATADPGSDATLPPIFGGPRAAPTINIPSGFAIVEHSTSGGKDRGITIHVRPENFRPSLPAGGLTPDEQIVINYTATYKPSYGGISNYRFHEANREKKITLQRWEDAKASLIASGHLDKRGALTVKGKNAKTSR